MVNWEAGKDATDVEQQMAFEGRPVDTGKISIGGNTNILDVHCMDPKGSSGKATTHLLQFPLAGSERGTLQALGQMGQNSHSKSPRWVGVKKHISILNNSSCKMWMVAHLHNQSVDQSYYVEIHFTMHSD